MKLNDDQIDDLKEKNEKNLDERPLSRQECRNLIRTIQAQQQEIEQLRKSLEYATRVLKTLDNLGGLGYDKHEWIRKALETIQEVAG